MIAFILTFVGVVHADERMDKELYFNTEGPNAGPPSATYTPADREMWDLLFSFNTTSSSQGGVATDGEFIYTSSFSSEMFRKFELDGTFVEEFVIPGIDQCGCMTYDGQYFYGAAGSLSDGIYMLDLENHSLVQTISVSASTFIAIGHLSFDPELADGAGGFWVGYWAEMAAVDRDGNEIVANVGTPGGIAGTGYDNITDPDNPCLYAFAQTGDSNLEFYRFDINTGTYSGVIHVATDVPAPSSNSVASGCNSYINSDGKLVLLGMIDRFPDNEVVFGYEISDAFTYTNDLSVQSLIAPVTGPGLNPDEDVIVKVMNNGTAALTGVDLQYSVTDGNEVQGPFTVHVANTLNPGEFLNVTFDDQADLSAPGMVYHFTITTLTVDENSANDVLEKDVENTSGVYCFASGAGGSEYISGVIMADVSNMSGDDHYTDYTNDENLLIHMTPGFASLLTITLANGYNANVGAVWIDWNGDGDFYDDGAAYVSPFGPGPYEAVIIPPGNAPENLITRMRIRLDYNNPNPDPCGSTSFGEVEDYAIVIGGTVGIEDDPDSEVLIPGLPKLSANYPNPFNPTTEIRFTTANGQMQTQLNVYDLNGKIVRSLVNGVLPSGEHTVVWDGRDARGEMVASGMYFYRLENEELLATRKMLLLK